MRNFLNYNRLPNFYLAVFSFLYFPQSIVGFYIYDYDVAFKFVLVSFVSTVTFVVFYYLIFGKKLVGRIVSRRSRTPINVGKLSFFVFFAYVVLILYAAFTVNSIAVVAAFNGASMGELSKAREEFLRTRIGWEALLPYVNAILVMALIPYCIASLFYITHRLRFVYLFVFLLCLMLTLEKSVGVMAFMPILVLAFSSSRSGWKGIRVFFALVFFILSISFLARGGFQESTNPGVSVDSNPHDLALCHGADL